MKTHLLANEAPAADGHAPPTAHEAHRASQTSSAGPMTRQRSGELKHHEPTIAHFGLLEAPSSTHTTPVLGNAVADVHAPPPLFLQTSSHDFAARASTGELEEVPEDAPAEVNLGLWPRVRRLLAFTGPGWLMSIAYVDPGNLEADLQCGAKFGYTLLWALLASTTVGLGMQLIAARLGCASRRHLAEHCRDHYSPNMRVVLWLLTELAIIGSDIQEVIGSAMGLELLVGIPLPAGVVVTAATAFGFLFLESLGTRPLELFFGALILVLAMSMGGLFAAIRPDGAAVAEGLFIPRMAPSAVTQVVGMVGCIIMPHNLFLHSALVQSRVVEQGEEAEAVFLFTIESSAAIITSLLINTSVVAVFAKGFYGKPDADRIGLANAGTYLGEAYGSTMRVIWALGLVAAGQSSTMTGAYAGQWVMQGYLQLKVVPWKRAFLTRGMALVPTLVVAILFGKSSEGLDILNEYLNVLQSLVLPFALVPLLTFAGARHIMGPLVLPTAAVIAGWTAAGLVMVANMYLLVTQFGGGLAGGLDGDLAAAGLALGMALYLAGVVYAAWAPRRVGGD